MGARRVWLVVPAALLALSLALTSCSSLPPLEGRVASTAIADTDDTRLGKALMPLTMAHPGLAGIHALSDGRDAFAARAVLAQAADRSLDVQYYIWRNDTTGRLMFDALRAAAERGVRVRLLLDDNNTAGLDASLAALDAHPMIEVRLFNPNGIRAVRAVGMAADFMRLNRRMHNKSFTADNQVTIIGGRNVGDEYFGAAGEISFADLDVIAAGPVVRAVSDDFDLYWNSPSAYPLVLLAPDAAAAPALKPDAEAQAYIEAIKRSAFLEQLVEGSLPLEWARARFVSDDPAKVMGTAAPEANIAFKLRDILGEPQRSLDLVSPYFVPGKEGTAAFVDLAKKGTRTRILTNSLEATDVAAVHAGYAKWRKPLLESGVTLYELRREATDEPTRDKRGSGSGIGSSDASLHAKTFGVDGKRVFVGSFNFDQRSIHLNTEMGMVIDSPALARRLTETLDRTLPTRAYEVKLDDRGSVIWLERRGDQVIRHEKEPGTSWFKRAAVKALSWLPIDWLL
ncbi:phospholipase D family protein [Massilia timonae]|uniref:Phospholipase D family protein n=1 Tax=Massilia timonae TaxID=47229 RepID=A0A1S2N466_9BURK|nr:phospholipase D family protein [Massilia timonae]OIJ39861.1 phospholipase D family protein [Massilia timonae]